MTGLEMDSTEASRLGGFSLFERSQPCTFGHQATKLLGSRLLLDEFMPMRAPNGVAKQAAVEMGSNVAFADALVS